MLCEMDKKVEIKQEPVWLEGTASTSFVQNVQAALRGGLSLCDLTTLKVILGIQQLWISLGTNENFDLDSTYLHLKEEIKLEYTEPAPTQPAVDIKDEIIIEEQTVDQLVPLLKEEDRFSDGLYLHAVAIPKSVKSPMLTQTGERPQCCILCGKLFSETTLKLHKRVCGQTFSTKPYPQDHTVVDAGKGLHPCTLCGKTFALKSNLERHAIIHTGERPHLCIQCGKIFSKKSDLEKHMLNQTQDRPHHCIQCDKAFSHNWKLVEHSLTHTREKRYNCNKCGKSFSKKANLKQHALSHTGERPHLCELCGRTFSKMSTLKQHTLIHTRDDPH